MHKKDQQGPQINFLNNVYVFNLNFRVISDINFMGKLGKYAIMF